MQAEWPQTQAVYLPAAHSLACLMKTTPVKWVAWEQLVTATCIASGKKSVKPAIPFLEKAKAAFSSHSHFSQLESKAAFSDLFQQCTLCGSYLSTCSGLKIPKSKRQPCMACKHATVSFETVLCTTLCPSVYSVTQVNKMVMCLESTREEKPLFH